MCGGEEESNSGIYESEEKESARFAFVSTCVVQCST